VITAARNFSHLFMIWIVPDFSNRQQTKLNTGRGGILFVQVSNLMIGTDDRWCRLLEDKNTEKATFKIDWDKWVDQDEADEGFDTSALVAFLHFSHGPN
jgi:hypothetical protein